MTRFGVGGPSLARAGIVLAAGAAAANVFQFDPLAVPSREQQILILAGLLLGAGGAAWEVLRGRLALGSFVAGASRFLLVTLQVALVVKVIQAFEIESPVFAERVIPLAALGFVVNHVLPARLRLPFFACLSLVGIWLVFGPKQAAWLIAVGVGLIGLCELPVPFALRVLLVVGAGVCLALQRAGKLPSPWAGAIWPILGSMFMFRLVVYLYDLRHRREPFHPWHALSYFFMLPNVVFPLFPVVDYATFQRTWYDRKDACEIYQRGIRWMLLGVTHLVMYRAVYQYLTISPSEVVDASKFGHYVTANFLLYFRVSGQFHLICGILHLFGFHLPETHRLFFFSSSFNDFWRRINIYWKDFMMKVVYFPTFFRLRKSGETPALIVATVLVFLVTWITHSYQWFWILGEWLISLTDMMFWGILALALIGNTLWEMRAGRKRSLVPKARPLSDVALSAVRTVLFFVLMSVLWSLWTAPTLSGWWTLVSAVGADPAGWLVPLGVLAGAVVVVAAGMKIGESWRGSGSSARLHPAWITVPALLAMLVITSPRLATRLPVGGQEFVRDLRIPGLNREDQELMERGYYEKLTKVNRFNSQLWEVYAKKGDSAPPPIRRPTGDFQGLENIPLLGVTYKGQPLRTNQWGMRDRDYDLVKPEGTYRIALMGASYVMGSGVGDGETFEWLLEDRLNREAAAAGRPTAEILNFAVGTLSSAQQLYMLQKRVLPFDPDAVVLVSPATDADLFARYLYRSRDENVEIPYEYLREIIERVGIDSTTTEESAMQLLYPVRTEILEWVYREFARECTSRGILPVFVYLTLPGRTPDVELIEEQIRLAKESGFVTFDLRDVYDGFDVKKLQVASWDWHPNPRGHRIIAERLYRDFTESGLVLP
jgi:D-alanyl-lipoteichoic acid acyltransferase DltB (MBOAT superfamily)